ncbi:MAG TPA: extracellular solute-binding protein, partial [Aggregatilineales bacterium]|nr:extracellular solute-binding protein [Aggregatilineales bacterium]
KDVAVPLGIYPSFMFVNKDLFDQASMPLPPTDYNNGKPQYQGKLWNMDAVKDLAIKLTQDKNGKFADEADFDPKNIAIYGFADIDVDMRGYAQLFSPGHAGVAPDGKTAIFNDKTYIEAMQWRHDAIFKYHFFPELSAQKDLNNNGDTNTFASGRVAMSYSHTWSLQGITGLKAKWVAAVAPVAPNGKLTARINADTFAVMQKSTHHDQAWEVIKWLTSPEVAAKACAIYGCLPARVSARADWEKQIKSDFPDLDLKVVYGAIKYLDIPNGEAPMPNYNQAYDTFSQFLTQLDSDPNLDVKAGLDKLNTQMQLVFDGKAPTETPEPAATAAASS